ncbi:MAG: hypothetical protein PHG96_01765 [Kiritimatiellae bacterium]|nr:hypothetical protein [Kiritimatiellia bacterium]MDD3544069.1 hypothetical protein [Kiritimatiellia bacterium]
MLADDADWVRRLEVKERESLAAMNLLADPKGEIRVRVLDPENGNGFDVSLSGAGTRCRFFPADYFPEDLRKRVSALPCAQVGGGLRWFVLKRTSDAWVGYVDERPVLKMPECWSGGMEIWHAAGNAPDADKIDDYTQKLGSFKFEDNFLVPAGSEFPPTWEVISGIWKLHSVTGSVSGSSGGYQLARQPKPEKSPNFYTLEGGGTNGAVLAGEPFYSRYVYRAAVQHNSGTNGLVFLAGEYGGYLAFTTRTDPSAGRLTLDFWRKPRQADEPVEILDTVETELPAGQWLLLEVQLHDDRVICRADNIEVIRRKMLLPPGGRFGLFSNMPAGESTRFDDVLAETHCDRPFDAPEDVAFATRRQSPGMTALLREGTTWLYSPPVDALTNIWEYGSPLDGALRQESLFVASSDDFICGLTAAEGTSSENRFRFTCRQHAGAREYRLEHVTPTNSTLLDTHTAAFSSNRVTLALDALRPNELRCYAEGRMVCFHRPSAAVRAGGVQGVVAAADGDMFFTAPEVLSRDIVLSERFEKNPLYVNDPYMRHWASPEGQWVTFKDGMTWFKGDITGPVKVRLPVVNGMELHLCVPEDASNGMCRVSVAGDVISVFTPDSGDEPAFTVPSAEVPEIAVGKEKARLFTLGMEGLVVWLGGDETLLARAHLSAPLRGRKMRIAGMTVGNLSRTLVKRDNVFDTLFTESLYNWTINGGRWEVINRFYCEPTWSHMNGESADSLAALWSKYVFGGDFCIEFYAGMRMGWYERPGDLNLTVMSRRNSTCDGYTAIATGWDPDHSQMYSRLLRDGEIMDVSTKYLVPRARAGLSRQGYQPLVAAGRDIHGAWYGMHLRRVGNRIQYIYDNEEVFDVTDPEPLQDGSLGIWTYRNSMMVARIKIAAESVKPRPFRFKAVPAGSMPGDPQERAADYGLRVNGRVAQPLAPEYWQAFDTVSHPHLRFKNLGSARPEMRVTSLLGGGTFLARCNLPPALPDKLLGWRFEIARHPQALVNFEFSTVKDDGKGGFKTLQGWTYVLSGTDETRGARKIIGGLEALPSTADGKELVWTPVEIWVPSEIIRANQAVQIEGFGNLQPSDVQQGLLGNPPHAWYAIRGFREIHRGVPVLTGPPEKREGVGALSEIVQSLAPGELQMVEVPETLDPRKPVIEWAVPELANFGLRAAADTAIPGSIVITPMHPWPSPMLPPQEVYADARPAPFTVEGNNIRVLVPFETMRPGRMTLALKLSDGRFFRQVVPMRTDEGINHPPVLLGLEMPQGGMRTFEARPGDPKPFRAKALASIDYTDPVRGGILKFENAGVYGRRLDGILVRDFDMTATPLLQFRYKGDPMAIVSMGHGSGGEFAFSEAFGVRVRLGEGSLAEMDNQWRVWTCIPSDSGGRKPLAERVSVPVGHVRVASRQNRDQTGLHSALCFDDVACGPAAGPNRPFAFKADYADPDGVAEVVYAIMQGAAAFDNRESAEQQALKWLPAKNGAVVEPDLAAVPDGIHHLVVKARDNGSLWSHPADVPFMLDREPPKVTHAVKAVDQYNGSCVKLTVTDPVAPPVLNTLRFTCMGTPVDISTDNGFCAIGKGAMTFELDWIWLLRKQLLSAKHGDVLPITVAGITDAAGNAVPPYKIDLAIDLDSDKRPPTVMPFANTPNMLCLEPSLTRLKPFFTESRKVKASTIMTDVGNVLEIKPDADGNAMIRRAFSPAWDPDKFPWLAISYRSLDIPDGVRPFKLAFNTGRRRPRGIKDAHTLDLSSEAHQAYITGDSGCSTGVWHDIIINARDFLKQETEERKDTPDLTYLSFFITGKSRSGTLQLRSVAVLAPWESDHLIPIRAYDLSSVKGITWSGGESDLTGLRPANLKLPAADPNWFRFRISDRRGNLTDTWTVPLPPGGTNINSNLPAFEAVEF